MKIIPFVLIGLLFLPETIIQVPIFPFGKADAHPIRAPSNNDTDYHVAVELQNNHHQHSEVVEKNPLECDACMFLANGLNQTVLHNPKVLAIVTTDMEQICQLLPSSVQQMCIGAAEQTAPLLLNHLGDFIATNGCIDLGICHTSTMHS